MTDKSPAPKPPPPKSSAKTSSPDDVDLTTLTGRAIQAWEQGADMVIPYVDAAGGTWRLEPVRSEASHLLLQRSLPVAKGYVNTQGVIPGHAFAREDIADVIADLIDRLHEAAPVSDTPWA